MELSFKLEAFEGPLDLLLHLIEKNKVNIYDIPIALITDQYIAFVEEMKQADLDVMSEFLLMAATLVDIKCRMLLPAEKNEEGEEIDPRDELVARLLEYKLCKMMAAGLRNREDESAKVWFGQTHIPKEVAAYRQEVDPHQLLDEVTLRQLAAVFRDVMRRREDRIDPIRSSFGKIQKESVDSSLVMQDVIKQISRKKHCTFRSLLERHKEKMYIVVTLLTVLELMHSGKIEAVQDDTFGEISITVKDTQGWDEDMIASAVEEME